MLSTSIFLSASTVTSKPHRPAQPENLAPPSNTLALERAHNTNSNFNPIPNAPRNCEGLFSGGSSFAAPAGRQTNASIPTQITNVKGVLELLAEQLEPVHPQLKLQHPIDTRKCEGIRSNVLAAIKTHDTYQLNQLSERFPVAKDSIKHYLSTYERAQRYSTDPQLSSQEKSSKIADLFTEPSGFLETVQNIAANKALFHNTPH